VFDGPPPIVLGPLPYSYDDVPARVVVNLCGVEALGTRRLDALHVWALLDSQAERLVPPRETLERFLDRVHADVASGPSYWHCHAGINRSSFALAAYLHRFHRVRISDAIALLRERRSPMVLCNAAFEERLRAWYGGPDEQDFVPFSYEAWRAEVEKHKHRHS
jgi:protein-tyrosine phosphatase